MHNFYIIYMDHAPQSNLTFYIYIYLLHKYLYIHNDIIINQVTNVLIFFIRILIMKCLNNFYKTITGYSIINEILYL